MRILQRLALKLTQVGCVEQKQQQQHKLYLHDYNYVVTILQKLQHKKTNKQTNHNNDNAMQ